jgi:hypothetical protein
MPAGKQQHVAIDPTDTGNHPICPYANVFWRFTPRASIEKQKPIWTLFVNVNSTAPLILTIVPFDQVLINLSDSPEARQLARPRCSLQGAGKDLGETDPSQTFPQGASISLATLGQRQVGVPCMLA